MDKDRILELSQQENRGKDVADFEVSKNAIRAGWIVTTMLTIAVGAIDYLAFGRLCYELLGVVFLGLAVVFFCKYARMRRLHELIAAVGYSVGGLCWITLWLLQVVKG